MRFYWASPITLWREKERLRKKLSDESGFLVIAATIGFYIGKAF